VVEEKQMKAKALKVVQRLVKRELAAGVAKWKSFGEHRKHMWKAFAKVFRRWEKLSLALPFDGWFATTKKLKAFYQVWARCLKLWLSLLV
jgi:hypothetical protein